MVIWNGYVSLHECTVYLSFSKSFDYFWSIISTFSRQWTITSRICCSQKKQNLRFIFSQKKYITSILTTFCWRFWGLENHKKLWFMWFKIPGAGRSHVPGYEKSALWKMIFLLPQVGYGWYGLVPWRVCTYSFCVFYGSHEKIDTSWFRNLCVGHVYLSFAKKKNRDWHCCFPQSCSFFFLSYLELYLHRLSGK